MITPSEYKEFQEKYEQYRELVIKRSEALLEITGAGFGRYNQYETIEFERETVEITILDSGYDRRDTCTHIIPISILHMSESEFKAHTDAMRKEKEKAKKARKVKDKQEQLERKKAQFERLKRELGYE